MNVELILSASYFVNLVKWLLLAGIRRMPKIQGWFHSGETIIRWLFLARCESTMDGSVDCSAKTRSRLHTFQGVGSSPARQTAFLADYDWWSPLLLSSISPVRISFFLHPPLNLFILFTTILSFVLTLSVSQSLVPRLHFLHLRHCYPSS